jgi:hypothetical protein
MVPHLFFYQLVLIALVWLFFRLLYAWPSDRTRRPHPATPIAPRRQRSDDPKPFAGLTQKPHCALCEQDVLHPQVPPAVRPDPLPPTHRRPHTVDTSRHFCPHAGCRYRGWLGRGNLRANGHPSGDPWRQFHCTSSCAAPSPWGIQRKKRTVEILTVPLHPSVLICKGFVVYGVNSESSHTFLNVA